MNPDHLRHLGRPIRPAGECPDCDHQRSKLMQPFERVQPPCPECGGREGGHYVDCSRLGE